MSNWFEKHPNLTALIAVALWVLLYSDPLFN